MDTEQTHKMTAELPPALKQVRSTAQWTISAERLAPHAEPGVTTLAQRPSYARV